MLARNRAFTAVAVIALALGIGANTAIFSVVYSILLKPLPYKDADRLAVANISVPDYHDLKEAAQAFDETAIWASNLYNLNVNGEAQQVLGAVASPSFFTILGQAAVGRVFRPEEEREALVVLSYDLWQRRFGGAADAIGRSLTINGANFTIAGVAPEGFNGVWLELPVDVWTPIAMDRAVKYSANFSTASMCPDGCLVHPFKPWYPQDGVWWLDVMARVPADRTPAA